MISIDVILYSHEIQESKSSYRFDGPAINTVSNFASSESSDFIIDDGSIDTIDKNEELVDLQNKYFEKSGYRSKITQHVGLALEIIPTLNKKFDLVFIDADKMNQIGY